MKENIRSVQDTVRRALLWAASNAGLYAFTAFLYTGVLSMGVLRYHHMALVETIGRYIVVPWGMALCLLRLSRAAQGEKRACAGILPLGLLFLWQIVPFAMRFGLSQNNMSCWSWYAAVYFGVYALTGEESDAGRESLLNALCAVMVVFSLLYAGTALYAAYTVQELGGIPGSVYGFGICDGMYLRGGVHYNITGMIAVCSAMLCLCAAGRFRKPPLRALSLLASVLMMAVVVLTQSRTARYVLIGVLAVGAYALVRDSGRRSAARHAAGVLAGILVLVAAYVGMSAFSNAALTHYEHVRTQRAGTVAGPVQIVDRPASGTSPDAEPAPTPTPKPIEPREAADASFSGRTGIWRNLFALWKDDPWHLLIGYGPGRAGSMVVEGTVNSAYSEITLHNTYLQFIADFGLIGFALKALFFLTILRPVLRVFLSRREERRGEMPLCMLVGAGLITGLMESAPLNWGTPMNVMLYFALGVLVSRGRQLARETE